MKGTYKLGIAERPYRNRFTEYHITGAEGSESRNIGNAMLLKFPSSSFFYKKRKNNPLGGKKGQAHAVEACPFFRHIDIDVSV
jgi:hypothetical protein